MLPDPAATEALIAAHLPALPSEDCPLSHAHGRILRRPIEADQAMPAFDRVTMDGYAVRAAAFASGRRPLRVAGFQAAGMIPLTLADDNSCIEIGTGAVLPTGADAVIPYEESLREGENRPRRTASAREEFVPYEVTWVDSVTVEPGRNVHRRGSDHAAGDVLVPAGARLGGGEIAVAAACGAAHLSVAARPSVAVVATGDELVEVDAPVVAAHQIRKSNDYALRAALLTSGLAGRVERIHFRDLRHEIEAGLQRLLVEFDVVLLTGGVSKGKFDFLPDALQALGVTQHLRGVAQRPGKPMWFGTSPRRLPVFALPGNPVSAYTCLHRYVLPALAQMAEATPAKPDWIALAEPVRFAPPLAYLLPVVVQIDSSGRRTAQPTPFNTSGDLGGLVGTDGFVELPADRSDFPAGTVAPFRRWV